MVRRALRSALDGGCVVCGETASIDGAVRMVRKRKPDLVIMDLGFAAVRRIRKAAPEVKILVFSMYHSTEMANLAKEHGANGHLSKIASLDEINEAVHALGASE